MVGLGIDRQMNQAEIAKKAQDGSSAAELTLEQKNKIKNNAVNKMKQIIAVIKDFSANIETIKSKMKDFNEEIERVCFVGHNLDVEQIANNKSV